MLRAALGSGRVVPPVWLAGAARWFSAAAAAEPALAEQHHHGSDQHSSGQDELEEFRDSVRQFATDFVAPHAAEVDRLNAYPPG